MNYLKISWKKEWMIALVGIVALFTSFAGLVFATQISETSVEITSISPEVEGCIDMSE